MCCKCRNVGHSWKFRTLVALCKHRREPQRGGVHCLLATMPKIYGKGLIVPLKNWTMHGVCPLNRAWWLTGRITHKHTVKLDDFMNRNAIHGQFLARFCGSNPSRPSVPPESCEASWDIFPQEARLPHNLWAYKIFLLELIHA